MIVCENLSKMFNENSGIRDIDLTFEPGIIYGIIGYNGSGKTTLLNCIEGLYTPTSGFVFHGNIKTTNESDFLPYRRKISFLPSNDYLYPRLTCSENIELAAILRTGKGKLPDETVKLIEYLEADSFLYKRFEECSTGMKKKIQIIVSLIGDIDTIIWDEPNNGLDILSNIKIKDLLRYFKKSGKIIIFSSHIIEAMEGFIDHCIMLQEGRVAEDTPMRNIESLEKLYRGHIPEDIISLPFEL